MAEIQALADFWTAEGISENSWVDMHNPEEEKCGSNCDETQLEAVTDDEISVRLANFHE